MRVPVGEDQIPYICFLIPSMRLPSPKGPCCIKQRVSNCCQLIFYNRDLRVGCLLGHLQRFNVIESIPFAPAKHTLPRFMSFIMRHVSF
jgi:hypothetical protein